jgi:chemotaxis protein methyltransferase CheR
VSAEHVTTGVRRAMARAAVQNTAEYRRLIDTDSSALAALITELTVGETYFLRETGQFEFIRREVLPRLASESCRPSISAWSAGCASGEEAYSLAIIARESTPPASIRVLGTDISQSRLASARKAVYGEWSLRGVPDAIVERYFDRSGRMVKVSSATRSTVEFRRLNLASADWRGSGIGHHSMDLIFCRNVLIYFDTATIARVAAQLLDSLSENGWLFLGASDPGLADLVSCEVIVTGAGLAYRRLHKRALESRHAEDLPYSPTALCLPTQITPVSAPSTPQQVEHEHIAQPIVQSPRTEAARQSEPNGGSRSPTNVAATIEQSELLARSRHAYEHGEYARAIDLARECVTEPDHDAEAWIILVRSLANLGLYEEAGLACASGLDVHRTSAELTYLHAMLLRQSARNAEALAALRCALYLDRQFVAAHLAMGDVSSAMGDTAGARHAFRNVERLLTDATESQLIAGSDGLTAGRLLTIARTRLSLLDKWPGG